MIDTKVVLVLTLLIGSILIGQKPGPGPAGGVPIPQHGINNAQ
jgi:hypothetical protein